MNSFQLSIQKWIELHTHCFSAKFTLGSLPSIVLNLPRRFKQERGKCEPIVVFIFLEIGIGDQEGSVQQRRAFVTMLSQISSEARLNGAVLSAALKSLILDGAGCSDGVW